MIIISVFIFIIISSTTSSSWSSIAASTRGWSIFGDTHRRRPYALTNNVTRKTTITIVTIISISISISISIKRTLERTLAELYPLFLLPVFRSEASNGCNRNRLWKCCFCLAIFAEMQGNGAFETEIAAFSSQTFSTPFGQSKEFNTK